MVLKGKVITGLGKGQWYILKCMPEFEKVLGFKCFPGTLNLKMEKAPKLPPDKKIMVKFEVQTSMPVDCYRLKINKKISGAIVVPHKTKHSKNIIEVIAPVNLRKELGLQDGDVLECELA